MQGRLTEIIDGKIQAFPMREWRREFALAKQLDLQMMEWTVDDWNILDNPIMSESGRKEIIDLQHKHDIDIPSITADFMMQKPFWKAEAKTREVRVNRFMDVCRACCHLGIKIIVIPLVDNGSIEKETDMLSLTSELDKHQDTLKSNSLRVAFELDLDPSHALEFISRFDSDTFGINYDIGNSAALGFDPADEFNAYGNRIINVHIKDRMLNGSTVQLGQGNANFSLINELLLKHNYSGNLILQTARSENGQHLEIMNSYIKHTLKHFSLISKLRS